MKKIKRITKYILIILIAGWTALTFWVEAKGKSQMWQMGEATAGRTALIVYDPDPFYNFDEQVCKAFAGILEEKNSYVTVATVGAAEKIRDQDFDLYVFCANTYNWRPDWALSRFVKNYPALKNRNVVAITLGSGATKASQKNLDKIILKKEANLIDSRSFWLLKPNDESRIDEKNVEVAVDMVKKWAHEIVVGLAAKQ